MSSRLSRLLGHFCRRTADLRFLPSRLAFALTVRSAGFNAAATTAAAACGVFFPVRALDAIRIVSVCAAIVPALAAATFSDTIRSNSAPSLDAVPAAKRIGHRHHSVMLVSRTAAPSSVANWSGVCRCAMWVKPSSGMFVPYGGDTGASSYFLSLNFATGHPGEVTKPLGARLLAIPVHATWAASFHVREGALPSSSSPLVSTRLALWQRLPVGLKRVRRTHRRSNVRPASNPYGATTIAIGSLPATDVKKPGEIK